MNQISMSGDVRGRFALPHLVDPRRAASEERDGFAIAALSVAAADALTASVIRASVEEHLSSGADAKPEYMAPSDPEADGVLDNLLGSMPKSCVTCRSGPAPARDRLAVVPSSVVRDAAEIEELVLQTRAIGPHVGLSVEEARFAAAAAQVLTENGLAHAPDSPCGLVISAGIEPATQELVIAAIDLEAVPGSGRPMGDEVIREATEQSRKSFGGLSYLLAMAEKNGIPVSVFLAAGTQAGNWRGRWRYSVRENVPGWCSAITLRRT